MDVNKILKGMLDGLLTDKENAGGNRDVVLQKVAEDTMPETCDQRGNI